MVNSDQTRCAPSARARISARGRRLPCSVLLLLALASSARAQGEERYWEILEVPAPGDLVLEVGGLLPRGADELLVATRRGEIWRARSAWSETPSWTRWAEGLQEPMGLLEDGDSVLAVQRGELTRIRDGDGDGRADDFETLCDDWRISGNYHEYAFGPCRDAAGDLWITLNKPFGDEPFGRVPWRGWALRIDSEGKMEPVACGLRSPCGIAASPEGEIFYTDNQGEWCGASKLSHLEVGDFHGHPHGIEDCALAEARAPHPGFSPERDGGLLMPEVARRFPRFKLPAVWFPYDKMGKSPSGFVWDRTEGRFGPFTGQIFVGDQHHASVMRVCLEKVEGRWQGSCHPFREGLACGVIRLAWAPDGSLIAGMSNRGWGSKGGRPFGIQRLRFTGELPFEVLEARARPRGFLLRFTRPLDPESARPEAFSGKSYTYALHEPYGSDELDGRALAFASATLVEDGRALLLEVDPLREGYVHEISMPGLRDAEGRPLLHPVFYYTLVRRPKR